MTILLSLITIGAWGCWIPLAQAVPGAPQAVRIVYVTLGNAVFAAVALGLGGGHLSFGWRGFWLPLAGGVVWAAGSYCAFRATAAIGLARASGSWAALNIIVAFVWGTLLFSELRGFTDVRFVILGLAFVCVVAGIICIGRSRDAAPEPKRDVDGRPSQSAPTVAPSPGFRRGLFYAVGAGVFWGSYFVPAQWAKVPAHVSDFPLALGMLIGATACVLPVRHARRPSRGTLSQLLAGIVFGIGNIALLGLVARVGTGTGFTIAQLSLLVNVGIGVFIFKVPKPGSSAARVALVGALLAGTGGVIIGTLR